MRIFLSLIFALCITPAWAQESDLHSPWDTILSQYLSEHADGVNRFDYDALRTNTEDRARLEQYINDLSTQKPSLMEHDHAFAFWANLYNAVTIKVILDAAPSRSIRQIRPRPWNIGPWGQDRVTVEGRNLSLNNIEHDIMRDEFESAQVHYTVNCASMGCPNLKTTAWRGDTLSADIEAAARAYINHPRGVTVTDRGLVVSNIYQWFKADFGGDNDGVMAHLLEYAEPDLVAAINANPRIVGHEYDWALNRP